MSARMRSLSTIAAAAALAACASTSGTVPAKPLAARAPPAGCVQDTGSRIPAQSGACSGFGHTFTHDDIDRTGETTPGDALRLLDPTITVVNHH